MAKLGKYNVVIEELDEQGNVWDSHDVLYTDDYDEASKVAQKQVLDGPHQQVAIWEWDDTESYVIDSNVVKTYES
jgi:hypothetical protein